MSKRVCVVIPAYNESVVLKNVIKKAKKAFAGDTGNVYDIVVVNDGSHDDTRAEALSGGAKVIDHILNSGAGCATATGIHYGKILGYDFVATMDADGQHAPEDVIAGVAEIVKQKADLMIGSRLINSDGMSRVKVIGNRGLSFITYTLFGVKTSDSQSGLRIYSRQAIEDLRWNSNGFEFCSEMIWRAKQAGMQIGEYPIQAIYTDYSKAKGQSNWNAINILKSLAKQRVAELFE